MPLQPAGFERGAKHPYLFEHHPERNVWSFFQTLIGGLNPWRFWKTLHPAQPADEWRLTLYRWIVKAIAALPLIAAGLWLLMMSMDWPVDDWPRQRLINFIDVFGRDRETIASELFRPLLYARLYLFVLTMSLFLLGLPEMTTAALLIFRASMRQAKIQKHHVDRCVAYSYDVLVWPICLMLGLGVLALVWPASASTWRIELLCWCLLLLLPTVWAAMSIRLACAYRNYLRMRHAVAAVAGAQVIVALVIMVIVLFMKELATLL